MPSSRIRRSVLAIALPALVLLAHGTADAQRLPSFPYEQLPLAIRSVHSGQCLDVRGAGGDGSILQQYTCGEQENQSWFLVWAGGWDYQLRPGHLGNVRLGISSQATWDGATAQLINAELETEIFRLTPNADGSFAIVNKRSGKCLDVPGWSTTPGIEIQQWWCSGGTNQRWLLQPRARPFHLQTKHTQKCLEVAGGSGAKNAPLQTYDCLGTQQDHQEWIAEPMAAFAKYWRVRAAHTDFCLTTVLGGSGLVQAKCVGNTLQQWAIAPDADGYVELRNRGTSTCVESDAGVSGTPARAVACSAASSQRFLFTRYVRRHVLVVESATTDGLARYTADPYDIQRSVDRANLIFRPYGIELQYDGLADHVWYDSDALHNLGDVTTWGSTYACDDPTLFLTPGECGDRVGFSYPDRVVIMIGPGANAGYTSGQTGFVFLRPGISTNQCGTGAIADSTFAHELGHYFGLAHVFAAGYADVIAAGSAYYWNGWASFDGDYLDDTLPDPVINGTGCLAPTSAPGLVWLPLPSGFWIAIPVPTDNVMSYYFNTYQRITPQQGGIVRATAYMRRL